MYDAWKDLTSALTRGYSTHGFEAWTIPILYLAGRYLRLFAIKSDEERSRSATATTAGENLGQDDLDPETARQAQLRDCEQHLKRMFTLCASDR